MCGLDLFIGQPRGRAHERAHKAVAALAAGGVDHEIDGEAGAIDSRLQRAQLVRQGLGQHRHDAIGEIDRIAAPLGFAVERAAGPHIPGDVGDRDEEMPAAGIGRVGIGLGPYRIVEIAGVAAVDRDQGQVAQIGAPGRADRQRRLGLADRRRRKLGREVERGDRQEADRAGTVDGAQPLDDAHSRRAEARGRQRFGDDELALGGAGGLAERDPIFDFVAAVGRRHPAAVTVLGERPRPPGRRRDRAGARSAPRSRRFRVPPAAPRRGRRSGCASPASSARRRIGPGSGPGQATGRASGTPSSSVPKRSTTVTSGSGVPPTSRRLAARVTAPDRSIWRSTSRRAGRSAGGTAKARAISRLPTADGLSRMNATMSAADGSPAGPRFCLGVSPCFGVRGDGRERAI